jgi:hypothetical protein
VGGSPGAYSVTATGEIEVTGAATGTVPPGGVTSVGVRGGSAVGDPPHGELTVSGPDGVIVTIDVIIT